MTWRAVNARPWYSVDRCTAARTLAAVGTDRAGGSGRYFTYTTASPPPFPAGHPLLPAEVGGAGCPHVDPGLTALGFSV